jgi:hypothetical protein
MPSGIIHIRLIMSEFLRVIENEVQIAVLLFMAAAIVATFVIPYAPRLLEGEAMALLVALLDMKVVQVLEFVSGAAVPGTGS